MASWVKHFQTLLTSDETSLGVCGNEKVGPLDFKITLEELNTAATKLKPGKAPGFDNITNEMIACILKIFPNILLSLFNSILESGSHIPIWSLAVIVPIHKKGAIDDANNYRGISLLSCIAKLFYSILNNRLLKFCEENGILSKNQLGFVPGNRTADALLILHNLIQNYCHKNSKKLYACFVDFSKAFDRLPRDILFKKLKVYGIDGKFLSVIQSLYANDQACVQVDGKISENFLINQGVRQGCVLSPLLFNIFMADLAKKIEKENQILLDNGISINSVLWADDLLLLSESEEGLNDILKAVDSQCTKDRLIINYEKTKCMIFNKTGRLLRNKFFIGDVKLENVRTYKYLGLIFTPSGELNSALNDLRARALKAYMGMKDKLGTCFKTHPLDAIQLFDALVKPILLYGSDFWGCLSQPKNNPIENLHLMFCKHLLGVQKQTTTDGVLLELGRGPLIISAKKAAVKNWERISMGKANPIVLAACKTVEKEDLQWITCIKTCLSEHGLGFTHLGNDPLNAHKLLYQRQVDIFNQTALNNVMKPEGKLRTYSLFKTKGGFEKYLADIRNANHRTSLSKFRLSNHQLMIEIGRHKKIPKTERYCQFCSDPVVEDEIHFLIDCKTYSSLREGTLGGWAMTKLRSPYHSSKEKFILLMREPSRELAKFVHVAMEARKKLLDVDS